MRGGEKFKYLQIFVKKLNDFPEHLPIHHGLVQDKLILVRVLITHPDSIAKLIHLFNSIMQHRAVRKSSMNSLFEIERANSFLKIILIQLAVGVRSTFDEEQITVSLISLELFHNNSSGGCEGST